MKSLAFILALLAMFLALPQSAEASDCGQRGNVRAVFVPAPQLAFIQLPPQPVTAAVVVLPQFIPVPVQERVFIQRVVRERRGPFFSLQIGR